MFPPRPYSFLVQQCTQILSPTSYRFGRVRLLEFDHIVLSMIPRATFRSRATWCNISRTTKMQERGYLGFDHIILSIIRCKSCLVLLVSSTPWSAHRHTGCNWRSVLWEFGAIITLSTARLSHFLLDLFYTFGEGTFLLCRVFFGSLVAFSVAITSSQPLSLPKRSRIWSIWGVCFILG